MSYLLYLNYVENIIYIYIYTLESRIIGGFGIIGGVGHCTNY